MRVATLITIPNDESFNNCTLCLNTLRVGFPAAEIAVYLNAATSTKYYRAVADKLPDDVSLVQLPPITHYQWIEQMVNRTEGELIIVDPDVIFWKEWTYKFNTNLAGMYVPTMWNEFAQCISYARLHTSFLQIRDCQELLKIINVAYPMGKKMPDYAPLNPFKPVVSFVNGIPMFWDSCAVLYNMLGGVKFTEEHLDCYDHVNSSSFVDIMSDNMTDGAQFKEYHRQVSENPLLLKGANLASIKYYERMAEKAKQLNSN